MTKLFLLIVLFQFKHFLCDYPLQTKYMLGKSKTEGWFKPLLAHAGVHSLGTLAIALFFVSPLLIFALTIYDLVVHFTMDRVKASPNLLGRFNISDPKFWWSLGFDQMVHHLTHYSIIFVIVVV